VAIDISAAAVCLPHCILTTGQTQAVHVHTRVSPVAQVFELSGGPKAPVPPARTGHSATVYQDKYLVVFGGEGERRVPRGWEVVQEQENGWEGSRGRGSQGEEESGRAMGRVACRCLPNGSVQVQPSARCSCNSRRAQLGWLGQGGASGVATTCIVCSYRCLCVPKDLSWCMFGHRS
jgi:hypothetical protein